MRDVPSGGRHLERKTTKSCEYLGGHPDHPEPIRSGATNPWLVIDSDGLAFGKLRFSEWIQFPAFVVPPNQLGGATLDAQSPDIVRVRFVKDFVEHTLLFRMAGFRKGRAARELVSEINSFSWSGGEGARPTGDSRRLRAEDGRKAQGVWSNVFALGLVLILYVGLPLTVIGLILGIAGVFFWVLSAGLAVVGLGVLGMASALIAGMGIATMDAKEAVERDIAERGAPDVALSRLRELLASGHTMESLRAAGWSGGLTNLKVRVLISLTTARGSSWAKRP